MYSILPRQIYLIHRISFRTVPTAIRLSSRVRPENVIISPFKSYCKSICENTVYDHFPVDIDEISDHLSPSYDNRSFPEDFDGSSFDKFLKKSISRMNLISDCQLAVLVRQVLSMKHKFEFSNDLMKFAEVVDIEFSIRAASWTMNECLVYFNLFNYLPTVKTSKFAFHIVKNRLNKVLKYDKNVVTEFIRLMNERKLWHIYYIPKYDIEAYFNDHLLEMSLNDVLIFLECMVNVKLVMNTPYLFEKLCKFVLHELSSLSSEAVVLFCRFVHLRKKVCHSDQITSSVVQRIYQHLAETEHLNAQAYVEVAHYCLFEKSLFNDKFFAKFTSKFVEQMCELPVEMLVKGLNCLTFYDELIKVSAVYDHVVNYMRQESFVKAILMQEPKIFILIMYYLSRGGVYPNDLLDILFSRQFLRRAYPKGLSGYPLRGYYVRGQELLTIDAGIEIECPEYVGNRLDIEAKDKIRRYYCWCIPALLRDDIGDANFEELHRYSRTSSRFLFATKCALENILGGREFVHTCYLLPHLPRPNLLFALDKRGTPQQLLSSVREQMIVNRDNLNNDLDWFTFGVHFTLLGVNSVSLCDEIPKIRQLKKLGLKVVKLTHGEWNGKNGDEIERSLRDRIFSSMKS